MPNDCTNRVTIYADEVTIAFIKEAEHRLEALIHGVTIDEVRVYNYSLLSAGKEAILFKITSAWDPINDFLNVLRQEYPVLFIKNEWYVEDGIAGVWVFDRNEPIPKTLTWDEGCLEEKAHFFRTD